MANMHDRGNGLGGGFAVYGIYPQFKDYYAFHVMYLSKDAKEKTDRILASKFDIVYDEEMQTKPANVRDPPLVWRYFVQPKKASTRKPNRRRLRHRRRHAHKHRNRQSVCVSAAAKTWVSSKASASPKTWQNSSALEDYQGYCGVATAVSQLTLQAGGAAHTHSTSWTGPSCTTANSPATA